MKLLSAVFLSAVSFCALALPVAVCAQVGADGPPPVLVVSREFLKPGRAGSIHEKTEAAFLAAAKANKVPFRYFALTSMTGLDRALFLSAYPNLAAWEAQNAVMDKMPSAGAALDHATVADGDLLSSTDTSVWMHRPELSLNEGNLVGVRYMEIQQVILKPGHLKQAEEWIKMYVDGYKNVHGANWATFQQAFGTNQNAFIFITLVKTLADADMEMGPSDKAFHAAMGDSVMAKLTAMEAEIVDTEMYNLFKLNPKMSLPIEGMMKAEPDFWTPPAAPARKPATKPATTPEAKPAT